MSIEILYVLVGILLVLFVEAFSQTARDAISVVRYAPSTQLVDMRKNMNTYAIAQLTDVLPDQGADTGALGNVSFVNGTNLTEEITVSDVPFKLASVNVSKMSGLQISSISASSPIFPIAGKYSTMYILAFAYDGAQPCQAMVTYADISGASVLKFSLPDWCSYNAILPNVINAIQQARITKGETITTTTPVCGFFMAKLDLNPLLKLKSVQFALQSITFPQTAVSGFNVLAMTLK